MKEEEEGKRRRNEGPNSEMKLIQRSRDREQCKRLSGHNNFSAVVVIFNLQHQNSPTIDFSSEKHFLAYFFSVISLVYGYSSLRTGRVVAPDISCVYQS